MGGLLSREKVGFGHLVYGTTLTSLRIKWLRSGAPVIRRAPISTYDRLFLTNLKHSNNRAVQCRYSDKARAIVRMSRMLKERNKAPALRLARAPLQLFTERLRSMPYRS